jgi:fumarate hydratase, class II
MTDTAVENATDADEYRTEHDTMGEVRVPKDALWRAQTQRAVENFPISGRGLERTQIRALGLLKGACAQVNKDLRLLDAEKADAIIAAAAEIADGQHDDQFPIDVFQTGSGTSSNMNTNEVIASIAARNGVAVHPNDDVNMSQSSNDTFPTATHIAATEAAVRQLIPALEVLHEALADKARQWRTVVKSGRTHLMDAVPVTLGQEFSGYARQIEAGIERVRAMLPRLGELAIGGTAVGTGLNAPDGFGEKVVEVLKEQTGIAELRTAVNSFEAQAARDGLVEASGALRTIAVSLTKIANDIRWMGSGPLTGLAEIQLPDLQPGSSIMPGKVNPVIPEAVTQVAAQVVGNDAAIAWGGAFGAFELNVYIPLMARNLLESLKILSNVSRLFAERCIDGLVANEDRLRTLAESSPSIVTPLNSAIGYEEAAAVAKEALKEHKTIRQAVIDRGLIGDKLSEEELDKRLDVLAMAKVVDERLREER